MNYNEDAVAEWRLGFIASVSRITIAEEWHTIILALFKQCSRTQRCIRMPHLPVQ